MHPCLFKVPKTDAAGNVLKGQLRMCGKKAVIAYKVEFRYKNWKDFKTVCFCPLHAPDMSTDEDFNRAALGVRNYWREANAINHGEVSIDNVRDSRIEVAMDQTVDNVIRMMNTGKNQWMKDEHWREVFERSIIERAVKGVVED